MEAKMCSNGGMTVYANSSQKYLNFCFLSSLGCLRMMLPDKTLFRA